jgi:hypothetical protein
MSENKELTEFVRSACLGIQKGITEGLELKDCIEFEVVVVNEWQAGVGLKLLVIGASTKYKKEEVTRIRFKVSKIKIPQSGRFGDPHKTWQCP